MVGGRTAHSFLPELEVEFNKHKKRMPVKSFADILSAFYLTQWEAVTPENYAGQQMVLVVAGFDPGELYGKAYKFEIPGSPEPIVHIESNFGMTWGGELEVASRLIQGYDPQLSNILGNELKLGRDDLDRVIGIIKSRLELPIPYRVLALQDCIDLAVLMIKTTIDAQRLGVGARGVGGPIDVATISRNTGFDFVQKKSIGVRE